MAVTFMKLKDGSWGLRGPAGMKAGERVTASRKDGTAVPVVVGRILFTKDGVCGATIEEAPKKEAASEEPKAEKASRGRSTGRGSRGRYECDECGEFVTPGTQCWETGCTH